MVEGTDQRVKIVVPITSEASAVEFESLWAVDLGEDTYRLDNWPVFRTIFPSVTSFMR